jgi:hypothetical protein
MFQKYLNHIVSILNDFLDNKYEPFVEAFRPFAIAILTTYIMIGAIIIFTGRTDKPKKMMWTMLAATIITTIVFSYGIYKSWLIDPVVSLSFKLQSYFLTGGAGDINGVFTGIDAEFSRLFIKLETISENVGWFDSIHISLVAFLLAMLFGALYLIFSVLIISSVFAMYVFFAIGGIPLFLAIIPATRFVFWAWLRAIATYALIPVFAAIVMALTLEAISIVTSDLQILDGNVWNYSVGAAFFVGALSIYFHFKSSEFAAALTGGQPSSIGGFMGSAISIGAMATMPLAKRLGAKALPYLGSAASAAGGAAKAVWTRIYSAIRGL